MLLFSPTSLDEPGRYEREKKQESTAEKDAPPVDRKLPLLKQNSRTSTPPPPSKPTPITAATLLEEDDPPLSKIMGFSKFNTTKGKKHVDYGAVEQVKKRRYRQYMNRPGGFNRPLDG